MDLLRASQIQLVVDVRKIPRSRSNPQFAQDVLPGDLAAGQIAYEHVAELGGRRGRAQPQEPSPNGFWDNRSFRNYADHALTEPFRTGLRRLRELAHDRRCAIMCAEAVWWRCHRRIITDYLLAGGAEVFHILGPGQVNPAQLTPGAVVRSPDAVVYPLPAEI